MQSSGSRRRCSPKRPRWDEVTTRWPSYFAWRLAPPSAAGPRLATSACYSFNPDMVAEHVCKRLEGGGLA